MPVKKLFMQKYLMLSALLMSFGANGQSGRSGRGTGFEDAGSSWIDNWWVLAIIIAVVALFRTVRGSQAENKQKNEVLSKGTDGNFWIICMKKGNSIFRIHSFGQTLNEALAQQNVKVALRIKNVEAVCALKTNVKTHHFEGSIKKAMLHESADLFIKETMNEGWVAVPESEYWKKKSRINADNEVLAFAQTMSALLKLEKERKRKEE
jgi:hypothetical protein